ncbi:hypothetical protein BGZ73_005904 [Actinomortierella ambigua]|nr:hypothetical protein BGZ73_005904 [Actinomortierella ambigua]
MEDCEVLQLILLDTLQHHLPKPKALASATAAGGSVAKTLADGGVKEPSTATGGSSSNILVHDLRTLLTQVYYQYQILDSHVQSCERVLRRLANLSFMSISHVDAMPRPGSPGPTAVSSTVRVEDAKQILKQTIGLASPYRAGLLTASQENRMISVAQKAVVLLSDERVEENEQATIQELSEVVFSVLLYSMREGPSSTPSAKLNSVKVMWLQRVLDLLILMADATPKLMHGIRWLLSGASLLWWDRKELALTVGRQAGQDLSAPGTDTVASSWQQGSSGNKHDADAELLEMLEDDEDEDEGDDDYGEDGYDPEDENPMADRQFEEWHACFLEHSWDVENVETGNQATAASDLMALLDRTVLVLPDVVLCQAGPAQLSSSPSAPAATLSADHPASQITKRLLQLAHEHAVQPRERLFFIRLLRRLEGLVPDESKWILLASSA